MPTQRQKKLYEVWKGRNKFFCDGRLIFGPDGTSVLVTSILIGGPTLAFCGEIISKLEVQDTLLDRIILIVASVLTILVLIFLFLTASRDPGIVPRKPRPTELDEIELSTSSLDGSCSRRSRLGIPRIKDTVIDGVMVKVKYCDTCYLYRPPRASHCSICNNCVQKFDHHCPWVGQCIGLRNYRFFFFFISSSTLLCIHVFTFSLLNVIQQRHYYHRNIWRTMARHIPSVVLIVYTFIAVWFVGGLTVFHIYLICRNQTTYENFRYGYVREKNPYNKGILQNIKAVFLSKTPSPLVDFRSCVLEDISEILYVASISREDLEIAAKCSSDNSTPVQSMDFSSTGYNIKRKNDRSGHSPFYVQHDSRGSDMGSGIADESVRDSFKE